MPVCAKRLRYAPLYLITPELPGGGSQLCDRLGPLLEAGIRLVQYRAARTDGMRWRSSLRMLRDLCREYGALLLPNADPEQLTDEDVDGVHLNSTRLLASAVRPATAGLLAVSCHNPHELARARALGADFVTLAPVCATPTHPQAVGIGWERFAAWITSVEGLPVYAQGGMRLADLERARQHGACGLAMLSGLWEGAPEAVREHVSRLSGSGGT